MADDETTEPQADETAAAEDADAKADREAAEAAHRQALETEREFVVQRYGKDHHTLKDIDAQLKGTGRTRGGRQSR